MLRNSSVSSFAPFAALVAGLAVLPLQFASKAREQAPAAAAGGRAPAGRRAVNGGRRGSVPTRPPSALRAVPAHTTAAKVNNPSWKAPRTAWGHPDLERVWTSDDMRGIPLDGRPHIASNVKQYMGDARGYWDGDTLVVETINFTDKTRFGRSAARSRS